MGFGLFLGRIDRLGAKRELIGTAVAVIDDDDLFDRMQLHREADAGPRRPHAISRTSHAPRREREPRRGRHGHIRSSYAGPRRVH